LLSFYKLGFHNDKLYEHLRPVVPYLVELLKDPEVNKFLKILNISKRKKLEPMLLEH